MKNRLKRLTLKIMLDTPVVSLGLIILVFAAAWMIASNAYVYKYINVSGTLSSGEISVSIAADIPFDGNFKNAKWSFKNSNAVYDGKYESDAVSNGTREIKYAASSETASTEKSVEIEIATQKMTLAQHIVRSFVSYGN